MSEADVEDLRQELREARRLIEQLTWQRDRYRKVVDTVSVLDSVKTQKAAMEARR